MESVPDEIQGIDGKAGKEQQKQAAVHRFLPQADPFAAQIQQKEHENCHAAVDIGPVVQPDLRLNIAYMSCKHIKHGKIGVPCLWKRGFRRCSHLQGINFRKQNHCRHASRKQGVPGKPPYMAHIIPDPFSLFGCQNQKGQKIYDHKNTDHNGDVIV